MIDTNTTRSPRNATAPLAPNRIRLVVWVSLWAVCFSAVVVSIFSASHQSKMVRVHATGVSAFVVNRHVVGDVSLEQHERSAMSVFLFPASRIPHGKLAVSVVVFPFGVIPATVFHQLNFLSKPDMDIAAFTNLGGDRSWHNFEANNPRSKSKAADRKAQLEHGSLNYFLSYKLREVEGFKPDFCPNRIATIHQTQGKICPS